MIERLTNCPSCGGTLNEAGRCEFCGSKVYDFLTIDFNERHMPSAKTYIRLKVKDKIVLAPVIVNTMEFSAHSDLDDSFSYDGSYASIKRPSFPKYNIEFTVIGDMIYLDDKGDND